MSRMEFLMIPRRAMFDRELSATDLRVLGAIAQHDRKGANGRGCFAAVGTLAVVALCGIRSAERSVSKLKERGHIRSQRNPNDGRQSVFRVVYDTVSEVPANSGGDLSQDSRQPDPNYPPTHFEVDDNSQGLRRGKQTNKQIVQSEEAYSAEAASFLRKDAHEERRDRFFQVRNMGGWLAQIEREIPAVSDDGLRLAEIYEDLDFLALEFLDMSDSNQGWAMRLMERTGEALCDQGYDFDKRRFA